MKAVKAVMSETSETNGTSATGETSGSGSDTSWVCGNDYVVLHFKFHFQKTNNTLAN